MFTVGSFVKVIKGTRDSSLLIEGSTHKITAICFAGETSKDVTASEKNRITIDGDWRLWNANRFEPTDACPDLPIEEPTELTQRQRVNSLMDALDEAIALLEKHGILGE